MTDRLHLTTPVTLQEFNPATMQTARSSVIIGKRNTGKTTLIKHLISKTYADIQHGTIITATDKPIYTRMVPDEQLHDTVHIEL